MQFPDFHAASTLEQHISKTLAFYKPNVFDVNGGFFQHFRDDGSIYDADTRHLVSSTRFVFNYAMAARYFADDSLLLWVEHGLQYIEMAHRPAGSEGYIWLLGKDKVLDDTNHCYGLAFVMVAGATALLAGVESGRQSLENAWSLMEKHFWDDAAGLYRDEANTDFSVIDNYRGQNANMHSCEAMLWSYEATGEVRYLDRAELIATNICQRQAAKSDGLVWEHFDTNWEIDWEYNKDNPKHLFRPWGFQAGHQTEWAKLLLILNRHRPLPWLVPRAKALFDRGIALGWDTEHGGICYGFDPDGNICDGDKYFWVQAESFAAAALLAETTGEAQYSEWYLRIWEYSWAHMIDHKYGAWYRILTQDNQKFNEFKSPAGKTDYHTMGACYEVLRSHPILLTDINN